jgi:uncharacterized membrane-anchored protein
LLDAGIAVVDEVGGWIMGAVEDGYAITIDGGDVYVDDALVASGVRHRANRSRRFTSAPEPRSAPSSFGSSRTRPTTSNTTAISSATTSRRPTWASTSPIVRAHRGGGHDYRDDLQLLRTSGYIGEQRPVLIGVDGGADALNWG